jgi:glycosyltransferase involved in cell wall biosynthesis
LVTTRFSVVIIAYKRKEFLIKAVNSVLNQRYPREMIEIIVVKSFEDAEIDSILLKEQVRCVYTQAKSIGKKFALGFELSTGEIVCLLEDDDEFNELKMETIDRVHIENPEIDVFTNGYDIFSPDGKLIDINYFKRNREFQSNQSLLKINSLNYDPNLFDLLNLYFNNSRFSYTKKAIESLLPIFNLMEYGIDTIIPSVWIKMNLTIAFIPGIKNKFMIRNYTHRLEKMLSANPEKGFKDAIERDGLIIADYESLISYFSVLDSQFTNFLSLGSKWLEIRTDVMSKNKRKLFNDTSEYFKLLVIQKEKKYKQFLKKINSSFIIITCLFPFFFIYPKLARKIIIRVLG